MGGKEEGRIREFVMMNFGDAVVEEGTSEEGEGAMIIKFKERYEAEEVGCPRPCFFPGFPDAILRLWCWVILIAVYGGIEGDGGIKWAVVH